jgi:hypothetical protein
VSAIGWNYQYMMSYKKLLASIGFKVFLTNCMQCIIHFEGYISKNVNLKMVKAERINAHTKVPSDDYIS